MPGSRPEKWWSRQSRQRVDLQVLRPKEREIGIRLGIEVDEFNRPAENPWPAIFHDSLHPEEVPLVHRGGCRGQTRHSLLRTERHEPRDISKNTDLDRLRLGALGPTGCPFAPARRETPARHNVASNRLNRFLCMQPSWPSTMNTNPGTSAHAAYEALVRPIFLEFTSARESSACETGLQPRVFRPSRRDPELWADRCLQEQLN